MRHYEVISRVVSWNASHALMDPAALNSNIQSLFCGYVVTRGLPTLGDHAMTSAAAAAGASVCPPSMIRGLTFTQQLLLLQS